MGYRNELTICDAVASLLDQSLEGPLQIVVVTSGGDRSAARVRARFAGVQVVESSARLLPGAARNVGVRAARGDLVAFLAADCLAISGWAAGRVRAHRRGYGAVAGTLVPAEPRTPAAWASHYLLFPARLAGGTSLAISYPNDRAHGLSFERDLLDRVGPFREDLRIGEDTDMARRLRDLGLPVWLAGDAAIAHRGPRRLFDLIGDQYRRGARTATFGGALMRARTRPRLIVGAARGVPGRFLWCVKQVRGAQRPHSRRILLVLPWVAAGALAHQLGWCRAKMRATAPAASSPAPVKVECSTARRGGVAAYRVADLPGARYGPEDAVVALTFDDGPSPEYTPQVLAVLERYGVRATFFMLGERAARHPEIVRQVAAGGHAIASHGWDHLNLLEADEAQLREQLDPTNDLLTSLIGRPVLGVRPPYGAHDGQLVDRLGGYGLTTVLWSVDTQDWRRQGARTIVRRAVRRIRPGDIILLHDGGGDRRQTVAALPPILERIARKGYGTITLPVGG